MGGKPVTRKHHSLNSHQEERMMLVLGGWHDFMLEYGINYRSSRSRNTVVDGEPVAAWFLVSGFLQAAPCSPETRI